VRERLRLGDSDQEVVDFMVSRYGEYVLLRPEFNGFNLVLWGAGPLMFLMGAGIAYVFVRRRRVEPTRGDRLSDAESARLAELLGD